MKKYYFRFFLLLAMLGYPLQGWCPPGPGVLLPDNQVYDFGAVEIKQTTQLSFSLLVNPQYTLTGTWIVDSQTIFNDQSNPFVIDPSSTCIPGTLITDTLGCTVTVNFNPASSGKKFARLSVSLCLNSYPCSTRNFGSNLAFFGTGLPIPVPLVSRQLLVILAFLFIVAVYFSIQRRPA